MSHRVRRHAVSVSLFPFLAVLICIMGALVILLVLMVARVGAGVKTAAVLATKPSAADEEALRQQLEDAQWRRELMEKSRAEKNQELAGKRAELSHLEDHIQRLESQAQQLLTRAKTIDEGKQLRSQDLEAARAELNKLKGEASRKKAELDQKQKQQIAEERWYALIPYDGPNGTRRQPIYIECTLEGITIQPEGLVLLPDDFQGPMGPGNPLDAALRTIRERLAQGGGKAGEPYPLLVVRPSGIAAYGKARAALAAWDDEFGYELISEDKKLVFGERDPVLEKALEQSVMAARQRQMALVAAMPRRFGNGQHVISFADESGGGGTGSGPGGSGFGGNGGNAGGRAGGSGPAGAGGIGMSSGGGAGGREGSGIAGQPGFGSAGSSAASRGTGSVADGPAFGGTTNGGSGGGGQGGNASKGPPGANTFAGGSSAKGGSGQAAGGQATGGAPNQGNSPGASGAAGKAGKGNSNSGATASGKGRGSNWGLPVARGRVTAITRPIHVAALADRLVIVPERGDDRPAQHIPISPQLSPQEVDAFVAAVQKEMKSWGLAVENGYWKPQVLVEVAPSADGRFEQLQTALEGSGFELQRKFR